MVWKKCFPSEKCHYTLYTHTMYILHIISSFKRNQTSAASATSFSSAAAHEKNVHILPLSSLTVTIIMTIKMMWTTMHIRYTHVRKEKKRFNTYTDIHIIATRIYPWTRLGVQHVCLADMLLHKTPDDLLCISLNVIKFTHNFLVLSILGKHFCENQTHRLTLFARQKCGRSDVIAPYRSRQLRQANYSSYNVHINRLKLQIQALNV